MLIRTAARISNQLIWTLRTLFTKWQVCHESFWLKRNYNWFIRRKLLVKYCNEVELEYLKMCLLSSAKHFIGQKYTVRCQGHNKNYIKKKKPSSLLRTKTPREWLHKSQGSLSVILQNSSTWALKGPPYLMLSFNIEILDRVMDRPFDVKRMKFRLVV